MHGRSKGGKEKQNLSLQGIQYYFLRKFYKSSNLADEKKSRNREIKKNRFSLNIIYVITLAVCFQYWINPFLLSPTFPLSPLKKKKQVEITEVRMRTSHETRLTKQ